MIMITLSKPLHGSAAPPYVRWYFVRVVFYTSNTPGIWGHRTEGDPAPVLVGHHVNHPQFGGVLEHVMDGRKHYYRRLAFESVLPNELPR